MKKMLLFMAAIAATILFANAQGTWIAIGDGVTTYDASTEIEMGIENLQVMHSDASGITDQADAGAPVTSYNDLDYENEGFIQGSNNGMYFAFLPTSDGTIDVALKMSSNKLTFIYELTDAIWTAIGSDENDIVTLTAGLGTANAILADPTFFTTPEVYDTHNDATGIWDGTVAIQTTGASEYMVISFPVLANKTYAVGCFGSKLMVRGVNFTSEAAVVEEPTAVSSIPGLDASLVKTEYYNILGNKIIQPGNGITIVKKTMSDGSVITSKGIFNK